MMFESETVQTQAPAVGAQSGTTTPKPSTTMNTLDQATASTQPINGEYPSSVGLEWGSPVRRRTSTPTPAKAAKYAVWMITDCGAELYGRVVGDIAKTLC